MKFSFKKLSLPFLKPAATSAGAYYNRETWYIFWEDRGFTAIGECAPLPHLSTENHEEIEKELRKLQKYIEDGGKDWRPQIKPVSSVIFGMEMAEQALLQRRAYSFFPSTFTEQQKPLSINGLIWMASYREMLDQVEKKITEGWKCIKLKIGAIDFEEEIKLISGIRERFPVSELELRVDANGAFSATQVLPKLERLAPYGLHSIEQPVKPGQWQLMADCVKAGLVPVALDEELIPLRSEEERRALLEKVKPDYIVLKPSLIGGYSSAESWLDLASEHRCGSWVTSSLESNIGLLALAQWTATQDITGYQGLGTGKLLAQNFPIPAFVQAGTLSMVNTELWSEPYELLVDYLCPQKKVRFYTSGSTGEPREIIADKSAVAYSCQETNKATGMEPGSSMLVALPMRYVAAKMQILRAWESAFQLSIIEPCADPLSKLKASVDITSLVPYQLQNSIMSGSITFVKKILVGGSRLNQTLDSEILKHNTLVWETYGMTETYSNIALREIGPGSRFKLVGDVIIATNAEGCLVISSKLRKISNLETRDLVNLHVDGSFTIQGRIDKIINSGGIKVNPREIEKLLEPQLFEKRYFINAVPSEDHGEVVGLFIEGESFKLDLSMLKKAEKPRHVFFIKRFNELKTGKIDKQAIVAAEIGRVELI